MHLLKIPEFGQVILAQEGHNNKRSSRNTWNREYIQAGDYVIRGVIFKLRGREALEDIDFVLAMSVI